MRRLLRGLRRGGWQFDRPVWEINGDGVGRAVYRARGQGQCYCLVAFAHDLPDEKRSDRVIAEAWDATFTLVDGAVSPADLDRLAANVPLQEAGRVSDRELVLSRANRSVRLWDHVVQKLAEGAQPDDETVQAVGYLMRTTAVYGSGKFGAADHAALAGRPLMDGPFRAEMLTVWLIRAFALDLVEHLAASRGGASAVRLAPKIRRQFGIGNSTGLGMAPFLVNHPLLLNAWVLARETALARVRSQPRASVAVRNRFHEVLDRSAQMLSGWATQHPFQLGKLQDLRGDLALLTRRLATDPFGQPMPWDRLWRWAKATLTTEGQELVLSLMLEPHGDLIDDLADALGADEITPFRIEGTMTIADLRAILQARYGWALATDHADPEQSARFWYVSEAKLEPRLGEHDRDAGAARAQPMDIARAAAALWADLEAFAPDCAVAGLLQARPEHRRILRRVQMAENAPYSEIHDNLLAAELMPIDMLRFKLSFFGATCFDPRSDRWVRITMYQNAPFPDELHTLPEDDWVLPEAPQLREAAT